MGSGPSRGEREHARRALSAFPRRLPFWRGGEKGERQMLRKSRGALLGPAAPTEAGGGRMGRRSGIAQPLCARTSGCESSCGRRQPRSPKKGIRKFSLGRNRGGASAHAHTRRGRAAGGPNLGRRWGPTRRGAASFVLRLSLQIAARVGVWGVGCAAAPGLGVRVRAPVLRVRPGPARVAQGWVG